jgi:hypothetical protein
VPVGLRLWPGLHVHKHNHFRDERFFILAVRGPLLSNMTIGSHSHITLMRIIVMTDGFVTHPWTAS